MNAQQLLEIYHNLEVLRKQAYPAWCIRPNSQKVRELAKAERDLFLYVLANNPEVLDGVPEICSMERRRTAAIRRGIPTVTGIVFNASRHRWRAPSAQSMRALAVWAVGIVGPDAFNCTTGYAPSKTWEELSNSSSS